MKNKFKKIVLASASPRRKELLKLIFNNFEISVSDCDETLNNSLSIYKQPEYLATLKGIDVAKKYSDSLIIAADTCVFMNDEILGKPKDYDDAFNMLKMLSGKTHKVITGCALLYNEKTVSFSVETEVMFYELSDDEINAYIDSGDCYDKAGAYGIQSAGGLFVKEIHGDYYNVVGLPIAQLKRQIEKL